MIRILIAGFFLMFFLAVEVEAGKLSNFEKDTRPKRSKSSYESHDDDDDNSFIGSILNSIFKGLFSSSSTSTQRSSRAVESLLSTNALPEASADTFDVDVFLANKPSGSPIAPYVRLDYAYQWVESDVTADNVYAELGYRSWSIGFSHTHFRESDPVDTLDLVSGYGQYRFIISEYFECDLALGVLTLDGEESDSGMLFGGKIKFYINDYFGGELSILSAALNENTDITDFDLGVYMGTGHVFFKTGYRSISANDEVLKAFYVGVSSRM